MNAKERRLRTFLDEHPPRSHDRHLPLQLMLDSLHFNKVFVLAHTFVDVQRYAADQLKCVLQVGQIRVI